MSAPVDAVVAFYENLRPDTVGELRRLYAPDAWFKDPFNEVVGHEAIERIFQHMFEQVGRPRFEVVRCVGEGREVALEWVFRFDRGARPCSVRGASVLIFDDTGRVCSHRDYWDAAEELYEKLPLLGLLMRVLRRRLSAASR